METKALNKGTNEEYGVNEELRITIVSYTIFEKELKYGVRWCYLTIKTAPK